MIKRPNPGDDEDDILRMQEEYLKEKEKGKVQPAAQVTKLGPVQYEPRKPSKYAQSRSLKGEKRVRAEPSTSAVSEVVEKNIKQSKFEIEIEDDKVYFPKVIPSLLGDIVERNVSEFVDVEPKMPSEGFPVVTSMFASKVKQDKAEAVKMDIDTPSSSSNTEQFNINLPSKSFILSSKEANEIHQENLQVLSGMAEHEILEEQKKLLCNMDPKLIDFLKRKRKQSSKQEVQVSSTSDNLKMDTDVETKPMQDDDLWENDVLSHPEVNKWLHFDSLEKDKLQWIKGIEDSKKINGDEPYEARFDFNGYLLPYTMEYNEKNKTLFHHGEEPHRPGYSITELIELSRSTITQQRVMALNTIAGILEYHIAGTYKNIIEIPLSKLFFIIRIAMDENKVIILEPALKAMRNLLYNRIDEASLDALIGLEEGALQPCLENDKSEIGELESKESEFNDFHLAEIDIITAILRTEILQRLFYILETIRPSFNGVQYCLQILSRLARDSVETAQKIVGMEHLMRALLQNFIPVTTINFVFNPNHVYKGKPVLSALKLLRILTLQSKEINQTLIKDYKIMEPVSEYISSAVNRSYGLKIQVEAFCILSNLLCFGVATDNAIALCPVIITALYKHVQGTDIFIKSSILSASHAAVILQLVNRLLQCNLPRFDTYKSQIYPLLIEGVQKWIAQLSRDEDYTCGHLRLLCSALDCCNTITLIECVPMPFLNDSLKMLSQSRGFENIARNLVASSNILSGLDKKDLHLTNNLMTLGTCVIDSAQKVLPILNISSPVPFLSSLFNSLILINNKELSESFLRHLTLYLNKVGSKFPSLCDNWFTRIESTLVFNIVKLSTQYDVSESSKDLLYAVANKLCYILRIDRKGELEFLFNNVLFNKNWFTAQRLLNLVNLTDADGFSKALNSIEDIKTCYSKVVNLSYTNTRPNVMFKNWQEPILPRDWIYLPILMMYTKSQEADNEPKVFGEHTKKVEAKISEEKEFIITCSLEWILFNELCFSDLLDDIDVTDRFCRILCVYLCDNSLFLHPKINVLLRKCTENLYKKKSNLNFDRELVGLHNFQDFYTQFLEQFQSVSYGDPVFASCVLVPLSQKHDVKWRKLLWSEYAGCLRALDCPEEILCYKLQDYLYPEETDDSLLKSYFQAISNNLVRPGTIAYKIASHHIECYKKRGPSRYKQ